MHQLILGTDVLLRDKIIRELQNRFFTTPDAFKFDFTRLEAKGLDFNDLKVALLTVPVLSNRRIILISAADKLSDQNLEFIEYVLEGRPDGCVLILEAAGWDRRNALRKRLAALFKVSGGIDKKNIFDLLGDLVSDRAGFLVRLQALLADDAAENALGAVRWWWCQKIKGTVPSDMYKKGLLVIQEADERIKLSGLLTREQTVEVALIKLSELVRPSKV
ncbi:MAG: hypothetical protein WCI27_07250 [Candidatus Omnitrophota bacterium]